jgi:hypothetical protein
LPQRQAVCSKQPGVDRAHLGNRAVRRQGVGRGRRRRRVGAVRAPGLQWACVASDQALECFGCETRERGGRRKAERRRGASGAPVAQWRGHTAVPPGGEGGAPGVRRAYTRNRRRASMEYGTGPRAKRRYSLTRCCGRNTPLGAGGRSFSRT